MTHHTISPSKWPNTGEPNKWFMHAAKFVSKIASAPGFWCLNSNFKYLTIRIDTRERQDFKVYVDGSNGEKIEVSADEVVAYVDAWRKKFLGLYPDDRPFQTRVSEWMLACFGEEIASDRMERNHRFMEESLELVQANGCTKSEAHRLVDYVFNRPVGELEQEVGGAMVTLAALCGASGVSMHKCGDAELERVWKKMPQIRAKQAAKPKHSPLPGDVSC